HRGDARTALAWKRDDGGIDGRPVRLAGDAAFVADPPDIRARVREHHRLRLQLADERPRARPVVLLLLAVWSLAVRAVEPDFVDRAVPRQQFGELVAVEVVVARRVAVARLVPIPRSRVQPGSQPSPPTRLYECAADVAAAAAKRARRHRMRRRLRRPQTEAVVMLRGEDHRAEAARFRSASPLPRVEP